MEAEHWNAGHEACKEAMRFAMQSGTEESLSELDNLEKQILVGELESQFRKEGTNLIQKAKAAAESGNFKGARESLIEAKFAIKRVGWEQGWQEVEALENVVESGEKQAALQHEANQWLMIGQVRLS